MDIGVEKKEFKLQIIMLLYGTNSITKKNSHQVYKHFENYSKQKKVLHASINHSNIPRPISTVLQIKTSQEIFEKIQEKCLYLVNILLEV